MDGVSVVVYSGGEHWDFNDPIVLLPESSAHEAQNPPTPPDPPMTAPRRSQGTGSHAGAAASASLDVHLASVHKEASLQESVRVVDVEYRSGLLGHLLGHTSRKTHEEEKGRHAREIQKRRTINVRIIVVVVIVISAAIISYAIKQRLREPADREPSTLPTTSRVNPLPADQPTFPVLHEGDWDISFLIGAKFRHDKFVFRNHTFRQELLDGSPPPDPAKILQGPYTCASGYINFGDGVTDHGSDILGGTMRFRLDQSGDHFSGVNLDNQTVNGSRTGDAAPGE